MNTTNRVAIADSYKYTHTNMYPTGTTYMFDYVEARSNKTYDSSIFFGLQYMLKMYFTTPITKEEVQEASEFAIAHGISFNYDGWMYIVNELNGMLPIRIRAVKEGTLVLNSNILVSIESTDEKVFWVASWFETFIMKVWYPITTATKSFYVKRMLMEYSKETGSEFVDFSLHNFSDRGSSSVESASIAGMAHLTQFQGTDNFNSLVDASRYYNSKDIGFSICATEHSLITSWGRENEFSFYDNFIEVNKDQPLIACVMDSYNIYDAVKYITSTLKGKIESPEYPKFVIRPDSGNPIEVINALINIMEENSVAYTENEKGYIVWNKYSMLWGDGIDTESMIDILECFRERGYSSDNIVFGSGGWLAQQHNRDTLGMACKCSSVTVNGTPREVQKDPITDHGKRSKKGVLSLFKGKEGFFTDVRDRAPEEGVEDCMDTVFENGIMLREQTIQEIRDISNSYL